MESWRQVWRKGFLPHMPTAGLEALAKALEADDPRLLQGRTTTPPAMTGVMDWPVEAACLIGYCGWKDGTGRDTVEQVENFFARLCWQADQSLGEPAGCRWLLNFWDETPRDEARRLLLAEVDRELTNRSLTR